MQKKWQIAKKIRDEFADKFPEINRTVLQLLANRGLDSQLAIDEFLNPDYGKNIHDPFLFRDMKKAVKRIRQAIARKETITVHGDYDADGVCAAVIMVSVLRDLGAKVTVYIPHRMSEGYGLNNHTVEELLRKGTSLIVTVDCGIASIEEVAFARGKGIDVIITDHHEAQPELPPAYALINPHILGENYPFRDLAGSGVAFKLAEALVKENGGKKLAEGYEKWLLDLVAIGTVGDCVPLLGENRTLVKYGMIVLRKTRRLGLRASVEATRFNMATLDTNALAFGIVPRLNAAGRIDHANTAYELLMCEDESAAEKIAADLERTNTERQKRTDKIMSAAKRQIGNVKKQKILFAKGTDWTIGIVGLVAGRLTDEFSRPAIVMGERGEEIVGSGRSVESFDITAALIKSRELLEHYGGHAAACGFTVKKKNYEAFIEAMTALAEEQVHTADLVKIMVIDAQVTLAEVNWELVELLEKFEPVGEGNPVPHFVVFGVEVTDLQKVGHDGRHLRLEIRQEQTTRKMIAFGFANDWGNRLKIGDMLDIVFELSVNEWNGNRELQLKLVDLKMHEN